MKRGRNQSSPPHIVSIPRGADDVKVNAWAEVGRVCEAMVNGGGEEARSRESRSPVRCAQGKVRERRRHGNGKAIRRWTRPRRAGAERQGIQTRMNPPEAGRRGWTQML